MATKRPSTSKKALPKKKKAKSSLRFESGVKGAVGRRTSGNA